MLWLDLIVIPHFHVMCEQTNCMLLKSYHFVPGWETALYKYQLNLFFKNCFSNSGIRPISGSSWAPFTPVMNAQYRASLWTSNSMPNMSR